MKCVSTNININGDFFEVWASGVYEVKFLYPGGYEVYGTRIEPNTPFLYEMSINTIMVGAVPWAIVGFNDEGELLGFSVINPKIKTLPRGPHRRGPPHRILFPSLITPTEGAAVVFLPFESALTVEWGHIWYTVYIERADGTWRPLKHLVDGRYNADIKAPTDLEAAIHWTAMIWGNDTRI